MHKLVCSGWVLVASLAIACSSDDETAPTFSFDARLAETEVNHALIAASDSADRPLIETDMAWTEFEQGVRSLSSDQATALDVTVSWEKDGQARSMALEEFMSTAVRQGNETIESEVPVQLTLAGNEADAAQAIPGHRACLTMCPYGVITNGDLPMSAMESHTFGVRSGVRSILPEKGSAVRITMGVRSGLRGGVRNAPSASR